MNYLISLFFVLNLYSNYTSTLKIAPSNSDLFLCTVTAEKSQFSKVGDKRLSYIFVINTNSFNCEKDILLDYKGFVEEWEIDFIGKNQVWKMNSRKEISKNKALKKACKINIKDVIISDAKKNPLSMASYYN